MKKELRYTIINGMYSNVLHHSPIGWDKTIINVERSLKTWGITRTYSVELRFPKDGATLLRSCFYNRLVNPVYLQIEKYDKIYMQYRIIYTGLIDFQDYEDSEVEVKVSVIDTNLTAIIKKYFSDTVDLARRSQRSVNRTYVLNQDDKLYTSLYSDKTRPVQAVKLSSVIYSIFYQMKEVTPEKFGIDLQAIYDIEDNTGNRAFPVITTERAVSGVYYTEDPESDPDFVYAGYSHELDSLTTSFESITTNIFNLFGLSWSVVVVDGVETLKFNSLAETFPATVFKEIDNIGNIVIRTAKDVIYGEVFAGFEYQPTSDVFDFNNGSGTTQYDVNREIVSSVKYDLNNKTSGNETFDMRSTWLADWFSFINKYFVNQTETGIDDIIYIYYVKEYDGILCHVKDNKIDAVSGITTVGAGCDQLSTRHLIENTKGLIKSLAIQPTITISYLEHYPTEIENFITENYPDEIPKKEFSDISIADNEHYFVPVEVEFDGIIQDIDIIDIYDPANSLYQFDFDGVTFKGYLIKAEINVSGKTKGKFTLLLHSENDLTKLIR